MAKDGNDEQFQNSIALKPRSELPSNNSEFSRSKRDYDRDSSKENKNKSSADYYRKSDRSDRESRDKDRDRDRDRERRRRREERNDSSSPIQGKIYERKQDGSISSRDKKDERKILYERKDDRCLG